MEPRFGHDFSQVHVHTDQRAANTARAVNELAFSIGQGMVFGAGHYSPETSKGRRLIAHELTHVVQQMRGVITAEPIQRQSESGGLYLNSSWQNLLVSFTFYN